MSKGRRRWRSRLNRESEFAFTLPFCSVGALSGVDGASPHWGGPSALLSSPIQTLVSSGNTLTDTPRNNVLPVVWAPFSLGNLAYKINHHSL